MVTLQKKQVKIISVLIALVFVGSVVALALTQSGSGIASAASSNVGVVDYRQIAHSRARSSRISSPRCRKKSRTPRRSLRRSPQT